MECRARVEEAIEIGPLRKRWSILEVWEVLRAKEGSWRVDDWKLERPQVEKSWKV